MASLAPFPEADFEQAAPPLPLDPAPATRGRPRSVSRDRARVLLGTADLAWLAFGIGITSFFRNNDAFSDQVTDLLPVLLPLYAGLAIHYRAYGLRALSSAGFGIVRALTALALTALIVMSVGFALKVSAEYSRIVLVAGLAVAGGGIALSRHLATRWLRRAFPAGLIDEVVLCDGAMLLPRGTERVLNATALGLQPRLDSPHMLDRLGRALGHADRVVIVCPPESRMAWTAAVKGLGINVEVLIPEIEALGVLATRTYDDRLTALVAKGPLGAHDKLMKRLFDLAVLVWVLPMLLLVTAIVAALIKLDDGGPVFFVQKRIGQGNRIFSMFKFRSMTVAQLDPDGCVSTARGDARVTRVGRLLRKTSIDELPQLFNVLLGDMSIVGPRPHALSSTAGDALFWDVDHRYWWRHAAKPGLTGLAQVRGFRGATETADDLTKRVQSDLEYLSGWSLLRDVRIMFATLKVILHPNAY